ncbi:hypothetical protein IGI04_002637 [Brassica rapa subsp. trilocularis]|uniref:HSF-type DNA-binding domain-containing protein n=1 Tax=Brassica rapa subsp. trilocularis TaxID=1813537 RepID=A0ABQ7NW55_BRACM|nr:hypothetical protein IGI04_002637 [Brassica rapa subsp. trilocularis]
MPWMGMSQFYAGVYEVVDDPSLDSIISWSKSNKSFVIWDPKELVEKILSRFFRNKLSQFISDLESHGFVRIEGSEHLEFGHEQYFVRGFKKDIKAAKEAEKNGSVGDQPPIRKMSLKDALIRFDQIMRPSKKSSKKAKAKTPLETIDE